MMKRPGWTCSPNSSSSEPAVFIKASFALKKNCLQQVHFTCRTHSCCCSDSEASQRHENESTRCRDSRGAEFLHAVMCLACEVDTKLTTPPLALDLEPAGPRSCSYWPTPPQPRLQAQVLSNKELQQSFGFTCRTKTHKRVFPLKFWI